jgi:predicted HTH transcriptional regulator
MNPKEAIDIESLQEDYDVEFKASAGPDGQGKLPKSFWETFSAMANTEGGYVFLGVADKKTHLEFQGMSNPEKVVKELWDGLNNPQKVSTALLQTHDIKVLNYQNVKIIQVYIPQASRKQKPIFINGNPLTGTYHRKYEGDYRCDEDMVKQMLAEQTHDTRDAILFHDYGIDDIHQETLKTYRQNFANTRPGHPFNDYNDLEFMHHIGGWTKDRQSGQQGLTLAGLLMFGKLRSILDVVPNYIVDYQERPRAVAENRWIDRITTDFSWSGNLYDFYRIVTKKLFSDLKIPFQLRDDKRIDDTAVHEALREALVNTLIHADYAGRCSILVVKRPDLFGFRNPGLLRVPRQDVIRGGTSDCRNRNLQKMFQLIGLGEQAGSGLPKIYKNWASQHWRKPELEERTDSNQTVLALRMSSLLPEDIVADLQSQFGGLFENLGHTERIAVVTARTEGCVTHSRLKELTSLHPHDLTEALHGLVEQGLLQKDGSAKAAFYYLSGEHPMRDDLGLSSVHKSVSSVHNGISSVHKPQIIEMNESEKEENSLKAIASKAGTGKRIDPEKMKDIIRNLCSIKELSIQELAGLLNRSEETIRTHYINPMCEEGNLERKYPNIKTDPRQKYRAAETKKN